MYHTFTGNMYLAAHVAGYNIFIYVLAYTKANFNLVFNKVYAISTVGFSIKDTLGPVNLSTVER